MNDRCSKCYCTIDVDEKICLDCKRGFFFPEKIYIILKNDSFKFETWKKSSQALIASLITVYLIESGERFSFSEIHGIDEKNSRRHLFKILNKNLKSKDSSHVLLVGIKKIDKKRLNTLSINWFKKGFEKVSFLFLQDS